MSLEDQCGSNGGGMIDFDVYPCELRSFDDDSEKANEARRIARQKERQARREQALRSAYL